MKVLITGSRDWKHKGLVRRIIFSLDKDTKICHGAARGADTMAHQIAKTRGMDVTPFPAKWTKYGKKAGPLRNQQMLDEFQPDLVIAFPLPASIGTYDMIGRAEKAGVPVKIVGVDGD